MSIKRKPTRTEGFLKLSRELRGRVEAMLKDVSDLAASDSDLLSASPAIGSESIEWKAVADRLVEEMRSATERTKARRDRVAEEFTDQFRRRLTSEGHAVHGEGSLLIVDGVVHVELDVMNGKARVNGNPHNDLSADALRAEVEDELLALTKTIMKPQQFIAQLRHAYEQVIVNSKMSGGSQVATTDLLGPLVFQRQSVRFLADPTVASFAPYPMTQFRADLFSLLNSEVPASAGFHWAPGSNTRGAVFMFVPALGRATHVGRVWFDDTKVEV